jgi:hypothetical protein
MTQESARWDAGRRASLRIAMRDHQYTPPGDLHDPTQMNSLHELACNGCARPEASSHTGTRGALPTL